MLEEARDGLLIGLLRAERELREIAEERARALARVLLEVAARVDGTVMEEARRADPRAPDIWGPEEWRAFFARALEGRWGRPSAPDPAAEEVRRLREEVRRLAEENRRLRERLAAREAERREEGRAPSAPAPSAPLAGSFFDPYHDLEFPDFPSAPPPAFAALRDRWRRAAMAVYAVAGGMSVRQEVMDRIARAEGIGPRSGSLRRLIEGLVEEGFLAQRVLELPLGSGEISSARVATLKPGEKGRALAHRMGWPVREGDLGRLMRLHRGEDLEAHTAAVLIFLYQARARGWRGMAVPEAEPPAAPDALVEKDGRRIYVEVERSTAEKPEKWRNLASLQGFVALCAPTPEVRAALAADCRALGLPGMATDIASLLHGAEDLWIEQWGG